MLTLGIGGNRSRESIFLFRSITPAGRSAEQGYVVLPQSLKQGYVVLPQSLKRYKLLASTNPTPTVKPVEHSL